VFARGNERWNGSDFYSKTVLPVHSPFKQSLEISAQSKTPVYFLAPGKACAVLLIKNRRDRRASIVDILTFPFFAAQTNSSETNGPVTITTCRSN